MELEENKVIENKGFGKDFEWEEVWPSKAFEYRYQNFKWSVNLKTRYKDMDASGYINNNAIITIFETA